MKINATSLTVDNSIVQRARAIILKSGMPFSVSKLVSKLLDEAFTAIETPEAHQEFPLIAQLRRSIHGETTAALPTVVRLSGAGISVNSGFTVTDIENIVERVLEKRDNEQTARVAESIGKYRTALPPSGEIEEIRFTISEPPPLKASTGAAPRPPRHFQKKGKAKDPSTG